MTFHFCIDRDNAFCTRCDGCLRSERLVESGENTKVTEGLQTKNCYRVRKVLLPTNKGKKKKSLSCVRPLKCTRITLVA